MAFENNNLNGVGVCRETEGNFARIFLQMQNPREPAIPNSDQIEGYQVVTGPEDEPIAVRKAYGRPSTLTLTDTSINGIPYPAGSILALSLESDKSDLFSENISSDVPVGKHRRASYGMVSAVRFMRVSAFALPPDSRRPVFSECFINPCFQSEQAQQFMASKTMDDILEVARAAAWEAIELR